MTTAFHFLFAALLLLISTPFTQGKQTVYEDLLEECADWAELGECSKNPKYMKENCPASCMWQAAEDERTKQAIGKPFTSMMISVDSFTCQICVVQTPRKLTKILTPNKIQLQRKNSKTSNHSLIWRRKILTRIC